MITPEELDHIEFVLSIARPGDDFLYKESIIPLVAEVRRLQADLEEARDIAREYHESVCESGRPYADPFREKERDYPWLKEDEARSP